MYSRQLTSKGMQEKWEKDGYWYKKDLIGQESIVENICSSFILACGVLDTVYYSLEGNYTCKSKSFLKSGETFITLDTLLKRVLNERQYNLFYKNIGKNNIIDKIKLLSSFYETIGIRNSEYDLKLMVYLDSVLYNVDRHSNNLGVIADEDGKIIKLNPIFDMGYSLGTGLYNLEDNSIVGVKKKLRKGIPISLFKSNSETIIKTLDQEIKLNFDIDQFLKLVDLLVVNTIPFRIFKIRIGNILGGTNKEVFLSKVREREKRYE